jgi:hypothetical protein
VSECDIVVGVEKEFEVGKNLLRKKLVGSTYAFKVVIATILLLLYNTVCVYRSPHDDHHGPTTLPQHLMLTPHWYCQLGI